MTPILEACHKVQLLTSESGLGMVTKINEDHHKDTKAFVTSGEETHL